MSDESQIRGLAALKPLPYHEQIRAYLKTQEPDVWSWYASNRVQDDQADSVRFELLKSTYRVDRESQPGLYDAAEAVKRKLALDVPITIYQAQNPSGLNASLAPLPTEAHIILHGPITAKLTDRELQAVLAHELSHLLLWRAWDGEYLLVDQVLSAMTHDCRADTPHFASARLFGLYTEIFCDRGSLVVVDDPLVVVSGLVKIETELEEVNAESYIQQAEEVFASDAPRADQLTHPEAFIRARAVKLWADRSGAADATVTAMIEGTDTINELDLLGQKRVAALTRRMLDLFLAPSWIQTDLTLGHARLFFEDYTAPKRLAPDGLAPERLAPEGLAPEGLAPEGLAPEGLAPEGLAPEGLAPEGLADDPSLADDMKTTDKSTLDYYCYVLLDFVTTDRDLEELPLAAALVLSERLKLKDRFLEIARKELRLRKRQLEKIDNQKNELLARVLKSS